MRKLTTEEFIEKAKQVHGDKYDYSLVKYTGANNKVNIICPHHGEFEQSPYNHTNLGQGCPICRYDKSSKSLSSNTEEFIKKAKKVHGDKYDYSKSVYTNSITKLIVICKKHGEFKVTPNNHLRNRICPKCSMENKIKKLSSNTEEFIKKAKKVHGDKYDYSKVVYNNRKSPIIIICPEHGEFEQIADYHLSGRGCQKCGIIKQMESTSFISGEYQLKYPEKYEFSHNPIYRSSYELKAFEMIEEGLETSDFIYSWSYESVVIPYQHNTQLHNYYVDIKLNTKNGVYLIEIKPENKLHKPNFDYLLEEWEMNQAKWKAARKYCEFHHYQFKIWTEKELGL